MLFPCWRLPRHRGISDDDIVVDGVGCVHRRQERQVCKMGLHRETGSMEGETPQQPRTMCVGAFCKSSGSDMSFQVQFGIRVVIVYQEHGDACVGRSELVELVLALEWQRCADGFVYQRL